MTRTDDPVMERLRAADPLPLDDLDRLLRETAPPDLSAFPAAPPRRGRRALWGAATAAAVAGVAGVLVVSLPRGEERAAIPGHIGILDRPATDADRLPEWVIDDEMTVERGIDVTTARLAQTHGGRRYYVAEGDRRIAGQGRTVCLIEAPLVPPPLPAPAPPSVTSTARATAGGLLLCNTSSVFERRFVAASVSAVAKPEDVIGIVPDGFERVTAGSESVEVHGNVFVLPEATGPDPVIATGPAGERRAYAGIMTIGSPDATPAGLDPRVSVLTRPPVAADRLPTAVVRAAQRAARRAGGVAAVTNRARFAGEQAGHRSWVMPDRRGGGRLAVATVSPAGSVSFRDVAFPTRRNPLSLEMQFGNTEAYGPMRGGLLGLVPDGFTEVLVDGRAFAITGNLIALRGISMSGAPTVELRGSAGLLRRTYSLGGFNSDAAAIPSNRVPDGAVAVIKGAAHASGLGRLRSATVAAGTPEQVFAATGHRVRSPIRGRLWVLTGTDGRRTVVVVTTIGPNGRPDPVMQVSRLTTPDLTALGRVRPLELTP